MSERIVIEGCAIATVDDDRDASTRAATSCSRTAGSSRSARVRAPEGEADRRIDGRGLPRHARARQLPPPPLPVGDARARPGRGPVRVARRRCTRSGRSIDARRRSAPPRRGAGRARAVGLLDEHRPPLPLPARRRRPARRSRSTPRASSACASTRAAGRWTSAGRRAACRRTRSSRTATRSSTATTQAIDRFHDPRRARCCRIAVAPCSPFSVTEELMTETAELARRRGVRLHTHLAETLDEEAFCLERFGVRPVEYLDDLGWLGDDVWLAHCIHLDAPRGRALRRDRHRRRALPELERASRRRHRAGGRPAARGRGGRARGRRRGLQRGGRAGGRAAAGPARRAAARRRGGTDAPARRSRSGRSTAPAAWAARTRSARWRWASSPTSRSGASTDVGHAGIDDPVAALVLGAARACTCCSSGGASSSRTPSCARASEQAIARDMRARAPGSPNGPGAPESPYEHH